MTVTALQNKVKKNITLIKDELILEKINQIIEENSDVYMLSDFQLSKVEKSRKQILDGNFFTEEEMDTKVEKWLNEK